MANSTAPQTKSATATVPHYVFRIPGRAPLDLTKHTLIDKNHKAFDIFFNIDQGFHNHLIHHYLSAFSMGADMKRLQEIFDINATYQRPMTESVATLTRETYSQELCNRKAYRSYLDLFNDEIEQHGMVEAVRYWMFKDDMLAQVLGGAWHPLIHLGYALEFNLPKVAAEALALAAVTEKDLVPLMYMTEQDLSAVTKNNGATRTIEEIVNAVHTDPELDGVGQFDAVDKTIPVLSNPKAVAKIREYASQWYIKDIESALKELYINCVFWHAATGIRKEGIKFDFFLVHTLTSVHAVYEILPYLNPVQAELVLRGHFVESLLYYVGHGRPSMQHDLLAKYQSPQAVDGSENPWLDVIKLGLASDEPHCAKAVRAIAFAQTVYGSPPNYDEDIFLKAAQATVDITGKTATMGLAWNHTGVGFKETWEQ